LIEVTRSGIEEKPFGEGVKGTWRESADSVSLVANVFFSIEGASSEIAVEFRQP